MEELENITSLEAKKWEERMKQLKKATKTSKVVDRALYIIMGAALLAGFYLNMKEGKGLLEKSVQQCETTTDKEDIKSLPMGRYSCSEIENFYSHQPRIYQLF